MVAFYIMLARPVGRFFTVLRMNFPVMLIVEDICGLQLDRAVARILFQLRQRGEPEVWGRSPQWGELGVWGAQSGA